jgi:endogenous inhibitor of DNA gyrase (YacG/DUF329 family)
MQPVRRQLKCPICGTAVVWNETNPSRPFCSERCKNIDLGAWSSGHYSIAADAGNDPGDNLDSE